MRILILGGTVFLGRAIVEAALPRGHEITLFHRGHSNTGLFPQVEELLGDRTVELTALQNRKWDAVIDTCGYVPRHVRATARALAGQVQHYTFISSISVYADFSQPRFDENAPLAKLVDENTEDVNGETYGGLKALCEQAAEAEMPGRTLIIRPGLIVGPHDLSDRFTYWPQRVAEGGEVLAPGRPQRPVQFIDVRDLAGWIVHMVEMGRTGAFNADAPAQSIPMLTLLEACKQVSGSDARFTWVDEAFLLEQGVGAWMEMPLWVPESDPANAGFFAASVEKAIASGLTFRPLEETVKATLDWSATRPRDYQARAGLSKEREFSLLQAWKAR